MTQQPGAPGLNQGEGIDAFGAQLGIELDEGLHEAEVNNALEGAIVGGELGEHAGEGGEEGAELVGPPLVTKEQRNGGGDLGGGGDLTEKELGEGDVLAVGELFGGEAAVEDGQADVVEGLDRSTERIAAGESGNAEGKHGLEELAGVRGVQKKELLDGARAETESVEAVNQRPGDEAGIGIGAACATSDAD